MDPRLTHPPEDVVTHEPLNAHTPWGALDHERTPLSGFYTRNNFAIPVLSREAHRMRVHGAVARALDLSFAEVSALPRREMDVVMECAGNARTRMSPRPEGTAWGERAVGCARFAGASLPDVLHEAGLQPGVVEIVFRGADGDGARFFERSLPIDVAMHPDTLVAYEMNGEPLPARHGFPMRLVVPRWYGVASVKWLAEIRAVTQPFRGHFQTERYVYETAPGSPDATPVREMKVKSLIVSPREDGIARIGERVQVRGWAWSGDAEVEGVDVSTDGGRTWHAARVEPQRSPYAWAGFSYSWRPDKQGEVTLMSRACDTRGQVQPAVAAWNVHGYGNNGTLPRRVRIM